MKRIVYFFCLSITFTNLFGQGRDNYWPLGYYSFSPFPDVGGLTVDFSNNTFNFYDHPREMWFAFTNASICNDTGALQFYTNGVYIANAADDTMLNGGGLNPSFYTTQFYQEGLRLPQADIIIPKPGSDSLYYLFHETEDIPSPYYTPLFLYCSIVNMNADSGMGEVIVKNEMEISDTLFVGALTACKHANGRDWWLLVPEYGNNIGYYSLLVSSDTIQVMHHNYYNLLGTGIGQACFSPDGSKYILSYYWGAAFFDFDRCSGVLTLIDSVTFPNNTYCVGASISLNSRYAYIGIDGYYIFQYDLQAPNILASKDTVAIYDGYPQGGIPTYFWLHQIAPDGKIYISTGNTTWAYHKIDDPDIVGMAYSNASANGDGVYYARAYLRKLIVDHNVGYLRQQNTDTTFTSAAGITVYPNPVNNTQELVITSQKDAMQKISVYNTLGVCIKEYLLPDATQTKLISVSNFNPGYYNLVIKTANNIVLHSSFIKIN